MISLNASKKKTLGFLMGLSAGAIISIGLASCGKPQSASLTDAPAEADATPTDSVDDPNVNPYPDHAGQDYHGEKNFAYLVNNFAKAKSDPVPWAGFWWPYTANGIASGTSGGGRGGYSPAGKYDSARGGTTNAQAWEVKNHGKGVRGVQGWWGHCNGWCVASALFPEPRAGVRVNGVDFGIADIKALLSEAGMEASADFFGNRLNFEGSSSPKFADVIPNQYFLILTNYIGKHKKQVLIDRYTGDQVWNQPVAGYEFVYPKKEDYLGANDPATPNIYKINMTSTLYWADDGVAPDIQTPPFDFQLTAPFSGRTLKMELWLDGPIVWSADGTKIESSGNLLVARQGEYLVGGNWMNGMNYSDGHPDYMWVPYSILKPTEHANNQVDFEWIKKHILSGGVDDPTVSPSPIAPAPVPSSSPSAWPSDWPTFPTPTSTTTPRPSPRPTSTNPAPAPTPQPTRTTPAPDPSGIR